MKYEISAVTDVGKVRQTNQDRYLVRAGHINALPAAVLVVADGMGGLSHGEVASEYVVQAISAWWDQVENEQTLSFDEISDALDSVIYSAHRQIYYFAEENRQKTGTTLSLLFLLGSCYMIKQIGDSRIYMAHRGEVKQLTVDQTWCNERIMEGTLTPEQASDHRLSHALVNALGVSTELKIVTSSGEAAGREFLLCSDGFYNGANGLIEGGSWLCRDPVQSVLQRMLDGILRGPANDNITAVLCRIPRR